MRRREGFQFEGKKIKGLLAAVTVSNDQNPFKRHREQELQDRKTVCPWGSWKDGLILPVAGRRPLDLPRNEKFHEDKDLDFSFSLARAYVPGGRLEGVVLKGTLDLTNPVKSLEDFQRIFPRAETALAGRLLPPPKPMHVFPNQGFERRGAERRGSDLLVGSGAQSSQHAPQLMSLERVRNSRKDHTLFGYQFLSGANPMLLRGSASPPARLVLPPGMEDLKTQLEKELQLQPPHHGRPPPMPFLPSDPPLAWLLAKTWVRSSDFQLHQLQSHLLGGHLMAEVISVATVRTLPSLHPIYKLLIPHFRYTMEINILARSNLVSKWGIFDLVVSTGSGGHVDILQRATTCLTYRSLCLPDDLADRGLLDVRSSLYGQDALRLWGIISSGYMEGMVGLFYKSDEAVRDDLELQA
ncbi:hypothetical protein GH733_018627 [Mirounga leonina]|nr:hypothetical protein GH733_018627 [Mirounga leonina]